MRAFIDAPGAAYNRVHQVVGDLEYTHHPQPAKSPLVVGTRISLLFVDGPVEDCVGETGILSLPIFRKENCNAAVCAIRVV